MRSEPARPSMSTRVPVVASGHTAAALNQQAEQLQGIGATGQPDFLSVCS